MAYRGSRTAAAADDISWDDLEATLARPTNSRGRSFDRQSYNQQPQQIDYNYQPPQQQNYYQQPPPQQPQFYNQYSPPAYNNNHYDIAHTSYDEFHNTNEQSEDLSSVGRRFSHSAQGVQHRQQSRQNDVNASTESWERDMDNALGDHHHSQSFEESQSYAHDQRPFSGYGVAHNVPRANTSIDEDDMDAIMQHHNPTGYSNGNYSYTNNSYQPSHGNNSYEHNSYENNSYNRSNSYNNSYNESFNKQGVVMHEEIDDQNASELSNSGSIDMSGDSETLSHSRASQSYASNGSHYDTGLGHRQTNNNHTNQYGNNNYSAYNNNANNPTSVVRISDSRRHADLFKDEQVKPNKRVEVDDDLDEEDDTMASWTESNTSRSASRLSESMSHDTSMASSLASPQSNHSHKPSSAAALASYKGNTTPRMNSQNAVSSNAMSAVVRPETRGPINKYSSDDDFDQSRSNTSISFVDTDDQSNVEDSVEIQVPQANNRLQTGSSNNSNSNSNKSLISPKNTVTGAKVYSIQDLDDSEDEPVRQAPISHSAAHQGTAASGKPSVKPSVVVSPKHESDIEFSINDDSRSEVSIHIAPKTNINIPNLTQKHQKSLSSGGRTVSFTPETSSSNHVKPRPSSRLSMSSGSEFSIDDEVTDESSVVIRPRQTHSHHSHQLQQQSGHVQHQQANNTRLSASINSDASFMLSDMSNSHLNGDSISIAVSPAAQPPKPQLPVQKPVVQRKPSTLIEVEGTDQSQAESDIEYSVEDSSFDHSVTIGVNKNAAAHALQQHSTTQAQSSNQKPQESRQPAQHTQQSQPAQTNNHQQYQLPVPPTDSNQSHPNFHPHMHPPQFAGAPPAANFPPFPWYQHAGPQSDTAAPPIPYPFGVLYVVPFGPNGAAWPQTPAMPPFYPQPTPQEPASRAAPAPSQAKSSAMPEMPLRSVSPSRHAGVMLPPDAGSDMNDVYFLRELKRIVGDIESFQSNRVPLAPMSNNYVDPGQRAETKLPPKRRPGTSLQSTLQYLQQNRPPSLTLEAALEKLKILDL